MRACACACAVATATEEPVFEVEHDDATHDNHCQLDERVDAAPPPYFAVDFFQRAVEAIHVGTDFVRPAIQTEPRPQLFVRKLDAVEAEAQRVAHELHAGLRVLLDLLARILERDVLVGHA